MLKKTFFWMLAVVSIPLFWYYTLVFSWFYKNLEVQYLSSLSWKIYNDSLELKTDIVNFKSSFDISNYSLHSLCRLKSNFLFSKDNIYTFSYNFEEKCNNENLYLKNEKWEILQNTNFKVNFISDFDLYNKYSDVDDEKLNKIVQKVDEISKKMDLLKDMKIIPENLDLAKRLRNFNELDYINQIIKNILTQRQNKYQIPIVWYELPQKNLNKLPNWLRPYRASYTNAIHEWWDIDAPLWTEVVSIDSWIIVKVVNNFKFSDLKKLNKTPNLSYQEKVKNLDILRWNQVWLKTMKGDVIFYSHLSKVYDDIKVWNIIPRWYALWKVWKTWVPDKDYEDYHLHFELRKNPYLSSEAWKYSLYDYMNWDWYFKWESRTYIKENQYNIFQK